MGFKEYTGANNLETGGFFYEQKGFDCHRQPPRRGNSDQLAKAFAKGAQEAGHTVTTFDAGRSKIGPCRACDTCFSKGVACSFDDDFNKLAPLLEQADAIALVSPLYWYDISAS